MYLFTGKKFLPELFTTQGRFSPKTVESVVRAALMPELNHTGRAQVSGHENHPYAGPFGPFLKLEGLTF